MMVYRIRIHILWVTADIGFGGTSPAVVRAIAPDIVIAPSIFTVVVIESGSIAGNDIVCNGGNDRCTEVHPIIPILVESVVGNLRITIVDMNPRIRIFNDKVIADVRRTTIDIHPILTVA